METIEKTEGERINFNTIVELSGFGRNTVNSYLKTLVNKGFVDSDPPRTIKVRGSHRIYFLTEKGKKELNNIRGISLVYDSMSKGDYSFIKRLHEFDVETKGIPAGGWPQNLHGGGYSVILDSDKRIIGAIQLSPPKEVLAGISSLPEEERYELFTMLNIVCRAYIQNPNFRSVLIKARESNNRKVVIASIITMLDFLTKMIDQILVTRNITVIPSTFIYDKKVGFVDMPTQERELWDNFIETELWPRLKEKLLGQH